MVKKTLSEAYASNLKRSLCFEPKKTLSEASAKKQ
jgi:hypothetical protein